jgi:hypothetical protein
MNAKKQWKKGRGKLGLLDPLLGTWVASADSPMGPVRCTRTFARTLNESYVVLDAVWEFGEKRYREHAIYGVGDAGVLAFWSFTSDGKRSTGMLADATDVHAEAIGFEAQMPAGLARMVYWPGEESGLKWAVESKSKKGWNRFQLHHYQPHSVSPGGAAVVSQG